MLQDFKKNITLFLQTPKDYLYSFKYSSKKKAIKINPFNPATYQRAEELMDEIKSLCPILNLYLIGSTGLQIEGMGDIDLYATATISEFEKVSEMISREFCEPSKVRKTFMEWKFDYKGVPVELNLRSPGDKYFQMQIFLFNLLKDNQVYLKEYRKLKRKMHEASRKEYTRNRMEFFNRILREANFN